MFNLFLYFLTVCIWGTTWLAIKFQLGEVPAEVSIFYRFTLAATLLLVYCRVKGFKLKFSLKEHASLCLLGFSMFSFHLIFLYKASFFLVSGLVSVIFSLVNVFNIVNSSIFFKTKVDKQVVVGSFFGFLGIVLLFLQEILNLSLQGTTLIGAGLALMGAFLFSLGNMVSRRNLKYRIDLVPGTAAAMGYGALLMLTYITLMQLPFIVPSSVLYWSSLAYLAIPGSIVGFLCYLYLISKIGPERAGYITVLFPVVALMVSLLFENYEIPLSGLVGLLFIVAGNCLVMIKKRAVPTVPQEV